MTRSSFAAVAAVALLGVWHLAAGCREQPVPPESPQRPAGQAAQEPEREDAAADKLAAEPAETLPPPPAPEPPEPPEPADPFHLTFQLASPEQKQPGWVQVMKFFNEGPPASVEAHWEGSNRITIDTQNVQHLCLDLGQLPVERRKSIALRLNGQGIELSRKYGPLVEFERTQAGIWRLRRE